MSKERRAIGNFLLILNSWCKRFQSALAKSIIPINTLNYYTVIIKFIRLYVLAKLCISAQKNDSVYDSLNLLISWNSWNLWLDSVAWSSIVICGKTKLVIGMQRNIRPIFIREKKKWSNPPFKRQLIAVFVTSLLFTDHTK